MFIIIFFIIMLNFNLIYSQDVNQVGKLFWSFQSDNIIFASPIVFNNKVYFGVLGDKFYCLDLLTGSKIWEFSTGITNNSFMCGPVVYDNKLYLVSFVDKKLRCINIENGQQIFEFQLPGEVESSLRIYNNKLFFGTYNGKLISFDLIDKKVFWEFSIGDFYIRSTPLIFEDKIYFGGYDKKFYCLNVNNGQKIWEFTTDGEIYSSPIGESNKIYFGSFDSNFYCLNSDNGNLIWKFNTSNIIISSPSIYNKKIYFGTYDNKFYCLNADNGNIIWVYNTGNVIDSSPVVVDNEVFFGGYDYKIYCLNAENGNLKWFYTGNNYIETSPLVYDGRLIIGNDDGILFCLDTGKKGTYGINSISGYVYSQSKIEQVSQSSVSSSFTSESASSSSFSEEIASLDTNINVSSYSVSSILVESTSTDLTAYKKDEKIQISSISYSSSSSLSSSIGVSIDDKLEKFSTNRVAEVDVETGITNYVVVVITNYVYLMYPENFDSCIDKTKKGFESSSSVSSDDNSLIYKFYPLKDKNIKTNSFTELKQNISNFTIQIAAYQDFYNAMKVYDDLKNKLFDVYITEAEIKGKKFFRVRVGSFRYREDAQVVIDKLKRNGYTGIIVDIKK